MHTLFRTLAGVRLWSNGGLVCSRGMASKKTFDPEPGFEERAKSFFVLEQVDTDVFRTSNLSTARQGSSSAAYGGLIFAQALAAAEDTVADSLKPHAIHSFFILNVNTSLPVQYQVRRIRDGRSFCTRTVEAVQEEKVAFSMQVSFHKVEPDSAVHQDLMPTVPHWTELPALHDAASEFVERIKRGELQFQPGFMERFLQEQKANGELDLFEIRPTSISKLFGGGPDKSTTLSCWCRVKGDLSDDQKLHRYLTAFNTDATMASSVYRPHFRNGFNPSMVFSLDHNVWMHEHMVRADEWVLFETSSSIAGRSRGFSNGKLWSQDGKLLLSCTQEVLVRGTGKVSRL